jgi:hypothetical protein
MFQANQRGHKTTGMGGHAELAKSMNDKHLQTDKPQRGACHADRKEDDGRP